LSVAFVKNIENARSLNFFKQNVMMPTAITAQIG